MKSKINVNNTSLLLSAGRPDQFPSLVIPQVAFSGRSNVGKSSLINTLLGRKSMARVSSTPGKTITVNFYNVDNRMMLVDLPGYGFAKRTQEEKKIWSALTDGYFTNNKNYDLIKLIVQLIDAKVGPTKDDCDMLSFLSEAGLPHIVVATKIDKLNKTDFTKAEAAINTHPLVQDALQIIYFSSQSGNGKEELWNSICNICEHEQ